MAPSPSIVRTRRGALLALALLTFATAIAATTLSDAQAQIPCEPVIRTLSNGNPASTDGAVSVTVDGLGVFGTSTAAGDAVFNPPGTPGFGSTTNTSHLFIDEVGWLVDDCGDEQPVTVVSESPLTTRKTFLGGDLELELVQQVAPVAAGSTILTQTYKLTNDNNEIPLLVELVRHLDGDLRFDGFNQNGGTAGDLGKALFEFDSVAGGGRVFLALSGSLDGDEVPTQWTIQPAPYQTAIERARGIPEEHDGVVHNDPEGFDVTLSQQWRAEIPREGGSVTLTTVTRFDRENRVPLAGGDAATTRHATAVDVDVRANDSDPDGDALSVDAVTQPASGTASVNPNGTVRYTPNAGFAGADSFTYTAGDGRGGTATAPVAVTVLDRHALSVSKTGEGTVVSSPAGINCGLVCTAIFDAGTPVTLTATPAAGWTFGGWGGACSGAGACTMLMDGAKNVTAAFLPPAPTGGQNANVVPVRGVVLVKEPGTNVFVPLLGADQIPIGSQLDTTAGAVELTLTRGVVRDTSEFYDGLFTILQANANAVGELRLGGGNFLACLTPMRLAADKRPVRRLWGSGRGRFRTRGRYSSATVRGTKWVTEDACGGTLTKVEEGSVTVFDVVRRLNVVVPAGRSYFAEPLPRGVRSAGCTIIGTAGKDILRGTRKRDVICGLGGNDVLIGLGGNDVLIGGDGNDRLLGGAGDDLLLGGAGNDHLNGGPGRDVLDGGPGNDMMVALDKRRGNDRIKASPGRDRCRTDWIKVCP